MITGGSRAHVSKKPGKTQTMNHYLIRTNHRATGDFYLVDLPGYGYAKASASSRVGWLQFTKDYFARRRQLLTVFVLVDSSVPVNDNDIMCLEWLAEHGVPSAVVFTKADKRDATRRGQTPDESEERDGGRAKSRVEKKAGNMRRFYDRLLEMWDEPPPFVLTSSMRDYGKDELLKYISMMIVEFRDDDGKLRIGGESDALEYGVPGFAADDGENTIASIQSTPPPPPDTKTALPWIQRTLEASKKKKKKKAPGSGSSSSSSPTRRRKR